MAESETGKIQKNITFSSGDFQLKGVLHLPLDSDKPPVVIGSHGLFSDKDSPKQIALAEHCNAHGMAYFRFDHRGCGDSEGNFKEVTGFDARCNDLLSAVSSMREQEELGKKIALFGSSLGGAACLGIFQKAEISALVTFAAPIRSEPVFRAMEKADDAGMKDFNLPALHFDLSGKLSGISHALIFHGDSDKVVSPSDAHRIYQKAALPKRVILLKNGDHRMSREDNQEKFYRESVLWFRKWLFEKRA